MKRLPPHPKNLGHDIRVAFPNRNASFTVVKLKTILGPSYHQPTLCPHATWNSTGVTFSTGFDLSGKKPFDIFIDLNNTMYVSVTYGDVVVSWTEGSSAPTNTISGTLSIPFALFVTINSEIYLQNGHTSQIEKWTFNPINGTSVISMSKSCFGLFVDINNTLYCSPENQQQVIKTSLDTGSTAFTTAAGTGSPGSAANMLHMPQGIFVDIQMNLYVADSNNSRIQLFNQGQTNGIPKAGAGASGTIGLLFPTDVTLDANGYLFIVDSNQHRIVGSDASGFRCLVGCSGLAGSDAEHLTYPQSMAFDSYGNIYVTDRFNNRIQQFFLRTNSCGKLTTTLLCLSHEDRRFAISQMIHNSPGYAL